MSADNSRLPARPSLEHLRHQARDHLKVKRAADPTATLADAQYDIARKYGFESWPKLVHHVENVLRTGRLEQFERLAADLLAGYHGDEPALKRVIAHHGVSYNLEQARVRVRSSIDDARAAPGEPTREDVRAMVAHRYGFSSWDALARGLAQPPERRPDPQLGLSATPPFYRIDWHTRTIEPIPPLTESDWDNIFAVMQEHQVSSINAAAISDDGLRRLSHLSFVTRISLGGASNVSDDGLQHLANMPQLDDVDLSGWHSPLTDRGLMVLRHLPNLRRFQMCWPQRISDSGIAHLAACDRLESVNLLGTPTGDGLIAAMSAKSGLKILKTGRLVTDGGLAQLRNIPSFRTWQGGEVTFSLMSPDAGPTHLLIDGAFTRAGLSTLGDLAGLVGLTFFWYVTALKGNDLGPLTELPNLKFLGCQDALCDNDAMRHIGALPRLRMLMGQGTVATDEGFAALARSRTLECIWGRDCPNLADRGFGALAEMPALRGLAVSLKNVSVAALSALPRFPALAGLMPMDVQDDGFRHVGLCRGLEDLWCMYCRDTGDAATAHIEPLQRLKTYYAGKTKITDRSLEILGRMPSLEKLEFWETAGITDAGLPSIARLPRLREVSLSGIPRVTREGMAVFPSGVRVMLSS